MDEIDSRILELIQLDGRITLSDLSKKMHLSRTSIRERLIRLQEQGVIERYTAQISPSAVGRQILAFIQVGELKVNCNKFEEIIKDDPDIFECHRVTGSASYLIKVAVADTASLELLIDRIIPYGQVNTSIVLSSHVPYKPITPAKKI